MAKNLLYMRNLFNKNMDQSDIKYILELLCDAMVEQDWDKVEEAAQTLKEFLDSDCQLNEE
jgi:hypothetical protein